MNELRKDVSELISYVPDLEQQRFSDISSNDMYEAISHWCLLGDWALNNDTKVNFPVRVREELDLVEKLRKSIAGGAQNQQRRYSSLLDLGERVLKSLSKIQPPSGGHLGILRIIHEQFAFLDTDYSFKIVKEEPIGTRFSSGDVFLQLEWAKMPYASCSFGAEVKPSDAFWIDDLLFVYGDERYQTLPKELHLDSESAVETWFTFLAEIFKRYGNSVFCNYPGIFDQLAKAQADRDAEYVQKLDKIRPYA